MRPEHQIEQNGSVENHLQQQHQQQQQPVHHERSLPRNRRAHSSVSSKLKVLVRSHAMREEASPPRTISPTMAPPSTSSPPSSSIHAPATKNTTPISSSIALPISSSPLPPSNSWSSSTNGGKTAVYSNQSTATQLASPVCVVNGAGANICLDAGNSSRANSDFINTQNPDEDMMLNDYQDHDNEISFDDDDGASADHKCCCCCFRCSPSSESCCGGSVRDVEEEEEELQHHREGTGGTLNALSQDVIKADQGQSSSASMEVALVVPGTGNSTSQRRLRPHEVNTVPNTVMEQRNTGGSKLSPPSIALPQPMGKEKGKHHYKAASFENSISSSSSACLSRENSTEHNEGITNITTRKDLENFIDRTLYQGDKDRAFLLRLEQELVTFAKETEKRKMKFPPMSSYHRMLVHRCAAYFGMDHNVESTGKCVVVERTSYTYIPADDFRKRLRDMSNNFTKMNREEKTFNSGDGDGEYLTVESGGGGSTKHKSILKRDAHSMEDYYFKGSTSMHSGNAMMNASASSLDQPHNTMETRRSKSFEEREEEYEKVRRRIFNREVQSQENEGDTVRPYVAKSFSFGGYTGNGALNRGDSTASNNSNIGRYLSKQDSSASSVSWRLSPLSSGYKSQSQMSESATPSPTSTPLGESTRQDSNDSGQSIGHDEASRDPAIKDNTIVWAVSDMNEVPKGSLIINPTTGEAVKNADGSTYYYDPHNPPAKCGNVNRPQKVETNLSESMVLNEQLENDTHTDLKTESDKAKVECVNSKESLVQEKQHSFTPTNKSSIPNSKHSCSRFPSNNYAPNLTSPIYSPHSHVSPLQDQTFTAAQTKIAYSPPYQGPADPSQLAGSIQNHNYYTAFANGPVGAAELPFQSQQPCIMYAPNPYGSVIPALTPNAPYDVRLFNENTTPIFGGDPNATPFYVNVPESTALLPTPSVQPPPTTGPPLALNSVNAHQLPVAWGPQLPYYGLVNNVQQPLGRFPPPNGYFSPPTNYAVSSPTQPSSHSTSTPTPNSELPFQHNVTMPHNANGTTTFPIFPPINQAAALTPTLYSSTTPYSNNLLTLTHLPPPPPPPPLPPAPHAVSFTQNQTQAQARAQLMTPYQHPISVPLVEPNMFQLTQAMAHMNMVQAAAAAASENAHRHRSGISPPQHEFGVTGNRGFKQHKMPTSQAKGFAPVPQTVGIATGSKFNNANHSIPSSSTSNNASNVSNNSSTGTNSPATVVATTPVSTTNMMYRSTAGYRGDSAYAAIGSLGYRQFNNTTNTAAARSSATLTMRTSQSPTTTTITDFDHHRHRRIIPTPGTLFSGMPYIIQTENRYLLRNPTSQPGLRTHHTTGYKHPQQMFHNSHFGREDNMNKSRKPRGPHNFRNQSTKAHQYTSPANHAQVRPAVGKQ